MAHNRHNLTWGFCHGRECGYLRNQLCLGWCGQCWHEWVDERGIDPLVRAARFYPPELSYGRCSSCGSSSGGSCAACGGRICFVIRATPPWCAPMAIRSSGELLPWRSDPVHHNNIMGLPWRPDPFIVGPSPNPPSPNPKPAKKMTSLFANFAYCLLPTAIYIHLHIGGWGAETNREIVSFRSCVRARSCI